METTVPYIILSDRLRMVPVSHGLQGFADEVRRAVATLNPDCIAVELPAILRVQILEMVASLPEIKVLAYRLSDGTALMIPGDPCDPLIEAVRLACENGVQVEMIDVTEAGYGEQYEHLPDELAVTRMGIRAFMVEYLRSVPRRRINERQRRLAARLALLEERHERTLYIGGIANFAGLRRLLREKDRGHVQPEWETNAPPCEVQTVDEYRLGYVLREIPYVVHLYENFRSAHGPEDRFPILEALQTLLLSAAEKYEGEYDERINLTDWKNVYQFARNLALVRRGLRPRLYELLMAAKGCVDDDFAAILLELATSYPPNHRGDAPALDEEHGRGRHSSLDFHTTLCGETVNLMPAYPCPDLQEFIIELKRRRPTEHEMHHWKESFVEAVWKGSGICSWPPEDEFVEDFFRKIRERAFARISEEHSVSEEFTSSLLDGLDIRETMRRWHEKKIIVRRERVPPGRVGPVVVIWRDYMEYATNIWQTCLYAETSNESDLALYAMPLGSEMVGPGISRTEYHGVLSVYPARGIPDIWQLPMFARWQTCGRILLAAAIMLSEERYVAYVASRPPDAELRDFARQHEKGIIFLPLGVFSRSLLKRARQCHILAGHQVRQWAGDYIPRI